MIKKKDPSLNEHKSPAGDLRSPRSLYLRDPFLKPLSFRGNRAKTFKSLSFRGNRAKTFKPLYVLFIASKRLRSCDR